ncbi:antibiotic biosynthesis monooxygenase [Streptomyces sp. NPDC088180]|uniref:antibiotic biosynthesis monooxygenase n=1 Tax=Streptomyces sp. NPDC088180 TaxID=3365837 RepID=UPI0037FB54F7
MTELIHLDGPDLRRTDVAAVFVGQRYVRSREEALTVLEQTVMEWGGAPWPAGILSFSCFLSAEEDTVLTYAQCADGNSYQPFVRSLRGPAVAGAVEYRPRRSVVVRGVSGVPGCVVTATFDVDGAERQDRVIDSLVDVLDVPSAEQPPGMLSANFHTSVDATRVLNYAEWTSAEAHLAFLDSTTRVKTLRASGAVPGVRPIGFKRFQLHRSIARGASSASTIPVRTS